MADEKPLRLVAYKVPIDALMHAPYIKENEGMFPSYVDLGNIKASRVNVIGIVVDVEETGLGITIDDGSAKISVRGFEPWQKDLQVGDIVNIIGRPREYGTERYIAPEISKKTNQGWMKARKIELERLKFSIPKHEETVVESIVESEGISKTEIIVQFIREKDSGTGVSMEEIIGGTKIENCEKIIEGMLKEGEVFENMPGKVKLLE